VRDDIMVKKNEIMMMGNGCDSKIVLGDEKT
jgi:hypothetical protein